MLPLPRRFLVIAILALQPVRLTSCQICLPIPIKSLADHIIEATYVTLAREDPNKPFSLISVGDLKTKPNRPEIGLFLDSATRRNLQTHPDRKIICSKLSDNRNDPWKRIGILTPELEPIVQKIIHQSSNWKNNPTKRLNYFARFLDHSEDQIRTLAHLEVARAPYGEIRTLGKLLPPEKIRSFLSNIRYLEWHALYIILLSGSDDESDHQFIREKMHSASQFSFSAQLAAWATAFLEVDQKEALTFLEEHYLGDPKRSPRELKAIFQAFSTHANTGHQHLRNRIVEDYRILLEKSPELAAGIVDDLESWQRFELAEAISKILRKTDDLTQSLPLRAYLRRAEEYQAKLEEQDLSTSPRSGLVIAIIIALPLLLILSLKFRTAVASR